MTVLCQTMDRGTGPNLVQGSDRVTLTELEPKMIVTDLPEDTPIRFRGEVSSGDDCLFAAVSGYFTVTSAPGSKLKEWSGQITINSDEPVGLFSGRLVMESGLHGEIFIRTFEYGNRTMHFTGSGPIERNKLSDDE